jgi:hypothetical protein
MLVSGKGHNPNYTKEAVKLLTDFSAARLKFAKKPHTDEEKQAFVCKGSFNTYYVKIVGEYVTVEVENQTK